MSYPFPASGGIKISYAGITGGAFGVNAGTDNFWLGAFKAVGSNQWDPVWVGALVNTVNFNYQVQNVGGIKNWLKQFLPQINAAFQTIWSSAPPPPAGATPDVQMNAGLATDFTLTVVNGIPTLAAK